MFCKWCGKTISQTDTSCPSCGRATPPMSDCGGLYQLPNYQSAQVTAPDSRVDELLAAHKKDRTVAMIWKAGLMLCIVVLLILFLVASCNVNRLREHIEDLEEQISNLEQRPEDDSDEHTHNYRASVTEPTCTEDGFTTYTCDCGDTYEGDHTKALGHRYSTEVTEPTCTEDGFTTCTCNVCGETYEEGHVAALGHTEVTDAAVAATCTATGLTEGKHCSVCQAVLVNQDVVPTLGHQDENEDYSCDRCEQTICQEHVEETVPGREATCTEAGLTEGKCCAQCGEILLAQEVIPAKGHSYEAVVTPPTCSDQGYTTHTCSACGDSYRDTYVVAPGHNHESVTTEPTCTDRGYTTHTCTVCGDSYEDTYVDAPGHDYAPVTTNPTCTEQGYTTYICSACGDYYTGDYVDAVGHSHASVVTEPTCTEQGYTTHTCTVCGDSYVDSYQEPLGHEYGDDGVCIRCPHEKPETPPDEPDDPDPEEPESETPEA